jgi:hypothetical protein
MIGDSWNYWVLVLRLSSDIPRIVKEHNVPETGFLRPQVSGLASQAEPPAITLTSSLAQCLIL